MKQSALVLCLAASLAAAGAQTAPKPASTTAKPATATHSVASAAATKLPPGIPPGRGLIKTAFSLRYQDLKIGTGPDAEPQKMYKVQYTGWRAVDGVKFDSSYDHPRPPVLDKDGKPVMGPDGKPKQGDPQPMAFPQGMGRLIPGFDQGFTGMKVGGKRRLFIPWQLAYGTRAIPDRDADHHGIPAKSDLIFDVELVDVSDLPMPQNHPAMGIPPNGAHPMPGGMTPHPPVPGTPGAPGTATPAAGVPTPPPAATAPKPAPPAATAPAATAPAPAATPQSK